MKSLTRFSWPILVELLLGFAVNMLLYSLLGKIADAASGAVGSVNSLFSLFQMMFLGLSQAGGILIARAAGSGNSPLAARNRGILLGIFLLVLTAVLLVITNARSFLIFRVLGLQDGAAEFAHGFCRVAQWSLAINALSQYFTALFRSAGNSLVPLLVALLNHSVSFCCLWLLPDTIAGLHFTGIERLAMSQLIGNLIAMSSALCACLFWLRLRIEIPRAGIGLVAELKPIVALAVMVVMEPVAYSLAQVFISRMFAELGETALAARSYAGALSAIPSLPGIALGWGAQMQVSYLFGAGKIAESRKLVLRSCRLSLLIGPLSALAVFLLSDHFIKIFSVDPVVTAATKGLLAVYVLLEIGRSCNTTLAPSLKACGEARFVAKTSLVIMLLFCVPMAWVLGFSLKLGVVGVGLALAADEILRGAINFYRWLGINAGSPSDTKIA